MRPRHLENWGTLEHIVRNEYFDTTVELDGGWISDEESFRLSIVKTIAGFNDPVAIEYLEELKIGKEEVQLLLSGSEKGYVAKGDVAGLVCPECSGCTMEYDPGKRFYPYIGEDDNDNQFREMSGMRLSSLWHGYHQATARDCIFFCHPCEKEFSMGEIYDSPFKTSEARQGLPPLYLREKEEVIQEIMDSESQNSKEYFVKHNAKEIMDYESRTGRNYIKAKQWYDDVRGEVDLRRREIPVFMKFGLSEEVSRKLAVSQFHQEKSSFAELRGDDTEEWINFINLTPRKIALNCEVSEEEAIEIFQILETERIKKAYSSRYWVIDPSNPNHKYEPELFSPSPVKGGDVDRDFIQEMEIEWNKIRRKKSFPEDARKWFEKYHLTRMGPL